MNTTTLPPAAADEFLISRILHAPRALVWQAWTDEQHLKRWWGPHGFDIPQCEMDLRVGGPYRVVMRSADGVDYPITGEFREVTPIERLVMTMDCSEHPSAWHDLVRANRAPGDNNPAGVMVQTATFDNLGEATRLSIRTRFESAAIRDAMLKMGMLEGWSQSLERLDTLVVSESGAVDRHILVSRVIDAPPARVFAAWTDPVQVEQWWGPRGFSTRTVSMDVREGGAWRFTLQGPDGVVYAHKVVYSAVVVPERLAYEHSDDVPEGASHFRSTVSFDAHGGKTYLTLFLLFATAAQRDQMARDIGTIGEGNHSLDLLQEYLAKA
jgi:uncharacterized protein YndB with AHSA1/START domain